MSLYNMVNKVNPATFFILPMLGSGHPDNWPRFRDCFNTPHKFEVIKDLPVMVPINEKEKPNSICVLLRIGGGNRSAYSVPWDKLRSHPDYVRDWDDEFDSTFAHIQFNVPEKWRDDYEKIMSGNYDLSKEYIQVLYDTYPKLTDVFDKLFNS